jgi:hypothetical protein
VDIGLGKAMLTIAVEKAKSDEDGVSPIKRHAHRRYAIHSSSLPLLFARFE